MLKKLTLSACIAATLMITGCSQTEAAAPKMTAEAIRSTGYEMASSRAQGFEVGSKVSARTVYVFFDPQCPHCGHLWEASKPLFDKVKFVWIPVGVLSPASGPQGAVLLAATDPTVAMQAHEDSLLAKTGGIHPGSAKKADIERVKTNTQLFSEFGFDGVPALIFKDKQGVTETAAGGMSTEMLQKALGL